MIIYQGYQGLVTQAPGLRVRTYSGLYLVICLCLRLVIFGSDRSSRNHSVCRYPRSLEHGHQAAGVITHDTSWFLIGHFASDWLFFGSDRSSRDHAVCLSLWHKLDNKSSSFDFITHDDLRMTHINFLFQEQF